MRVTRTWLISFIILQTLLSGCAVRPRFKTVSVRTAKQALTELVNRSESVKKFTANTDCNITGSFGTFKFRTKLRYSDDEGWLVKMTGPLGINLAIIESVGDDFHIEVPYNSSEITIDGSEPIEIPDIEMTLPNMNFLTRFLLPVTLIDNTDEWYVVYEELSSPCVVGLRHLSDEDADSLALTLDLSPLRLHSEELWQEGELQIKRNFKYKSVRDNVPKVLEIFATDVMFEVSFNSVQIEMFPKHKPIA